MVHLLTSLVVRSGFRHLPRSPPMAWREEKCGRRGRRHTSGRIAHSTVDVAARIEQEASDVKHCDREECLSVNVPEADNGVPPT